MAINPLQQPIQYGVEPQDPSRALLEGLQIGGAFRQRRQMREQEQLAEQYKADASAYYSNPTPQGALELARKYPEQGAAFMQEYRALGAEQRKGEFNRAARALSAVASGRTDIAKSIIDDEIKAAAEAGGDTSNLEMINAALERDPNTAYASMMQILAVMDPEATSSIADALKKAGVGGAEEGYRALTAEEVAAKGLPPGNYQVALGGASKGKVSQIGGGGVNVTVGGAPAETFTPKELQSFQDAVVSSRFQLDNIRRAREALPNAIVGAGAEARFELAKLAQLVSPGNKDIDKALSSTRALVQSSAESALGSRFMITGDGQGPATEGEQLLLNKARAGDISFTEPEWQELLNILDRVMRYEEQQGLMDLQAAADAGSEPAKVRLKRLGMPTPTPAAGGGARGATPTNVEVDY
jgi:hypothetical protein